MITLPAQSPLAVGRRRFMQSMSASFAAILASSSLARAAAPSQLNIAYFVATYPSLLIKGENMVQFAGGTTVNWIEVSSGAEINTGMAAGSIDMGIGMGSVPAAAGIAQGIPYQVIAVADNIGPAEEMTVRTSAKIKVPADFKGKKVATPFGSTSHFRLLGFLQTNGLSERDVEVLDLRGDAMMAAWARGDIDAGYIWSPQKSKMLESGGEVFRTYDKLEAAGYIIADVFTSRTQLNADHPEMPTALLMAYKEALAMYTSKPDATAALVGKYAGISQVAAKADMAEFDFIPLASQLTPRWLGTPVMPGQFAKVLKNTADFLVAQKSIRSAPNLTGFEKGINVAPLLKVIG